MKRKKRRIRNGQIFLNLLPCIAALGVSGTILCKTYGPDITEAYNQWKIQNKYLNGSYSFELDIPSWDDIKERFGFKEETVGNEPTEVVELPITITEPVDIEPVQEDTIEEVIEEEPEPVIYPEYTSSELLDSGYEFMDIDFDGLKEQNPDIVGWIDVPGTSISYPVVQGEDNDFYLHHDLDGNESINGTIFIDNRVDLDLGDDSSTIQNCPIGFYGHHMNPNRAIKMFQPLMKYKEKGFVDSHPFAVYYSPEGVYKLDIFADQYYEGASDEGLFTNQLYDEDQYVEFINTLTGNSSFNTGIIPEYGDKIGYLITCSYEKENYRYAIWYRAVKQYTNEIDMQNSEEESKTLTLN